MAPQVLDVSAAGDPRDLVHRVVQALVEGKVVAYAGRIPEEPDGDIAKYKLPQGFRKSLELFNIDRAIKQPAENPLVIVEGFKHAPIPKLEVWRRVTGEPLLHPNDPHIVAVASDGKVQTKLPLLDLNDDAAIAAFILSHLELHE